MKKFGFFFSKKNNEKRIKTNPITVLKYAEEVLTQEELDSFANDPHNEGRGFYEMIIPDETNIVLAFNLKEAKGKVHELINWYRESEKGAFERMLLMCKFKRLVTTEAPFNNNQNSLKETAIMNALGALTATILLLIILSITKGRIFN